MLLWWWSMMARFWVSLSYALPVGDHLFVSYMYEGTKYGVWLKRSVSTTGGSRWWWPAFGRFVYPTSLARLEGRKLKLEYYDCPKIVPITLEYNPSVVHDMSLQGRWWCDRISWVQQPGIECSLIPENTKEKVVSVGSIKYQGTQPPGFGPLGTAALDEE